MSRYELAVGVLEKATRGDCNALGELCKGVGDVLRPYLRRRFPKLPGIADDVVQEVRLALLEHIREFRSKEPASFVRWVLVTGEHCAKKAIRVEVVQRVRNRLLGVEREAQRTPSHEARALEFMCMARSAVAALPSREREAVRLLFEKNLTAEEAARILGKSPGAVRQLVHRASRRLRAQLHDFARGI